MSSINSKPASIWPDYRTMINQHYEQASRDVDLALSMSFRNESKFREDSIQQQLDSNLFDVDRNLNVTYDGSAVKKFLKEMAILKANVYEDLVKAENNALQFLEMEERVGTLIPTGSSNNTEGSLTVRRINELLSGGVGCGCKKQAASPYKTSKFQEIEEFVHKTAGLGKISEQEQAKEKLDAYYHVLMPSEITKDDDFGDNNMDLYYIQKRLREIKDTCRTILISLDRGDSGITNNSLFKDQQNTKGFGGVSFGRGRMTGLKRMDGTILGEPSKNTDGKALWMKKK